MASYASASNEYISGGDSPTGNSYSSYGFTPHIRSQSRENQALIGANEELRALIWEMRRKESAAEHLYDDLQDVILARDNQISSHMNEIDHLRYERRRMSEISALEEEVVQKVGGNMSRVQAWTEIIDKVKSRLSIGIKDLLQLEVGVIKGFYGVDGEWAMGIYDILERRYLDLAAAFEALIPRVYALEILKDADNLYEALRAPRLDNYFRRSIRGGIEQSQFKEITDFDHSDTCFNPCPDRWFCL
ncbi:hypothetical protein Tco_1329262 [Tanacetum coccineum]